MSITLFSKNEWKRSMRSKSVNSAENNYIVGKVPMMILFSLSLTDTKFTKT